MDKWDCRPSFNSASFKTMDSTSSRIFARSSRTLSCSSNAVISTSWGLRARTRPSASYSVISSRRNRIWTSRSTPYLKLLSSKYSRTSPTKTLTTKRPTHSKSILWDSSCYSILTVSRPWSKSAGLSKVASQRKVRNQIMATQARKALWSEETLLIVQKSSFLALFYQIKTKINKKLST